MVLCDFIRPDLGQFVSLCDVSAAGCSDTDLGTLPVACLWDFLGCSPAQAGYRLSLSGAGGVSAEAHTWTQPSTKGGVGVQVHPRMENPFLPVFLATVCCSLELCDEKGKRSVAEEMSYFGQRACQDTN